MSAIFGIYDLDGRETDQSTLSGMGDAMVHRGPDGVGYWLRESIGLGHRNLDTTPESRSATMPMKHSESGRVITADARIDIRLELARAFGIAATKRPSISDSELILFAYEKWGQHCTEHLLGDFAFSIWDPVEHQLFCARDPLGIKPFNYYSSEKLFAFSSEVPALLRVPAIPKQINDGRIADYLVGQLEGINKQCTFYEHIYRLPPAHLLVASRHGITIRQYWELDPEFELRLRSDEEYLERFEALLKESVASRLRSQKEPGIMLSGGIDSSAIAGMASDLLPDISALKAYSGVSNDRLGCQETNAIYTIKEHLNLDHHDVSPSEVSDNLHRILSLEENQGEPFDAGMSMISLIYHMAQSDGRNVMLDGVEGDIPHSLPLSYPTYLLRSGHLVRGSKEITALWRNYGDKAIPLSKVWAMALLLAFVPIRCIGWRSHLFPNRIYNKALKTSIINHEFAEEIKLKERLAELSSHSCKANKECRSLRQQHIAAINHPFLTIAVERYDRVAASCSIEPRHPLLDRRLVEYSVSLPWDQLVRNGWNKFLQRKFVATRLPKQIAWAKGRYHLGWDFRSKLSTLEHEKFPNLLNELSSEFSRYINPHKVHSLLETKKPLILKKDQINLLEAAQLKKWLDSQTYS